jgi:hypothetical protein
MHFYMHSYLHKIFILVKKWVLQFCLNLGLGFLFLFDWIRWTHLLGFCFGFSLCLSRLSNQSLHIFLDGDSQLTREITAMWMWQCCSQLCYLHLQHFVEVQQVLDYRCEVVHLTVNASQDPVIGT